MLLQIYPLVSMVLVLISCQGFVVLIQKIYNNKEQTAFQRFLQYATAISIAFHILSTFVLADITYLSHHNFAKLEVDATEGSLFLEYLNQNMLRCVSILCLNVALVILVELDPSQERDVELIQTATITYTILRILPSVLFHAFFTESLQFKVMALEAFMASESVVLIILWALIYLQLTKAIKHLQASYTAEKVFVEATLEKARNGSRRFVYLYCINLFYKLGQMIIEVHRPARTVVFIRDVVHILKMIHHMLNLKIVNIWLFIDIAHYHEDVFVRVLKGIGRITQNGLRFFRFQKEDTPQEAVLSGV